MTRNRTFRPIAQGMLAALGVLGLSIGLAASRARAQESAERESPIAFRRTEWKVGDRVASKSKVERSIDYRASVEGEDAGGFEQKDSEVVVKTIEILAVDEDGPAKIRVRYEEHQQTDATGDEEPEAVPESLLEGRTFLLELRDGKVEVADEDGAALSAEVEELVRTEEVTEDDRLEVGVDLLADLIAEKPRRVGEAIEVPADVAEQIFAKQGSPGKVEIRLELVEVREIEGVSCGVFDTAVEVEGSEDGIEYGSELEGETWIAVETARFHGAEMSGRLTVDGEVPAETGSVDLTGEGTIEVVQSRSYSRE